MSKICVFFDKSVNNRWTKKNRILIIFDRPGPKKFKFFANTFKNANSDLKKRKKCGGQGAKMTILAATPDTPNEKISFGVDALGLFSSKNDDFTPNGFGVMEDTQIHENTG